MGVISLLRRGLHKLSNRRISNPEQVVDQSALAWGRSKIDAWRLSERKGESDMLKRIKSARNLKRGLEMAKFGQHEAAIEAYDESLRLNPNNVKSYCGRGTAKSELGRHRDAILDYDEAIRREPNHFAGLWSTGNGEDRLA